ncbi:hypothetical protein SAY86_002144 [Trapa natans]|uniref:E3 UFM1-protein ligase 1 homolog n=1 Tax=Trapa natans TaxID=22666 RepID=A0AAN7LQ96_TRANT|nr:hypothetical protein SAY86_002144 [Trapa natans]
MDFELLELQRQFEFAQQAKSSIRLSERNVVELVQKLHELCIIDFDLLHTVSGKEYITPEQLRYEIVSEVEKLGRVSLIDLADTTGVDLYHVEKQAEHAVVDNPRFRLIQGEIISERYWDSVAEEINERLQECSQIALAELATQLHVGVELLTSVLEARLGTVVKGRLEGGQLYTPAYVARVSAMVRGAARGITVPTNLSALWSSLQHLLQEMDGASGVAVEGSFFQALFNAQVKEGQILGSLRAGVYWTPSVFSNAQKECIDSLFSQNSFINYETLNKLGISQPVQFLQSRYPDGLALINAFVHPSLTEMVNAAIEDAIECGSWIDSLSVLPASFGSQDASKILSHSQSLQSALKCGKAFIFGDSFVFSVSFVKNLYDCLEKELEIFNASGISSLSLSDDVSSASDAKMTHVSSTSIESNQTPSENTGKHIVEKGSKKKKSKASGSTKTSTIEDNSDSQDYVPTKSKKNQKKNKDTFSPHVSEVKSGAKEDLRSQEESINVPSQEWVVQKAMKFFPDWEEQGIDNPLTALKPLANYLRPLLLNSLKEKRKALLMENANKMKGILGYLQGKVDEAFLNLQLYEKALELFDEDQSTTVVLHRHLLRTSAASIADILFINLDIYNKLKSGLEVDNSQNSEFISLNPGERIGLAKTFRGSLSKKAIAVAESLEGKRLETFMVALRDFAEDSGIVLKKLDKKLERTLLHSYRKDLISQVSAETDPVSLLAKVVSLLYVQFHNKALQAPGRAISVAVTRLKDKLEESAYTILKDYQAATVTLLALVAASSSDEQDCSSDRIATKRELLEGLMPQLKGLVLTTSQSSI